MLTVKDDKAMQDVLRVFLFMRNQGTASNCDSKDRDATAAELTKAWAMFAKSVEESN